MISFDVLGLPKGEPRPRAFVRGKRASVYVPKTADDWKHAVRAAWPEGSRPKGPVKVALYFRMPRPLSHHVSSNRDRPLKPSAPFAFEGKPDVDNLAKAVLDALGPWPKGSPGLAWEDDSRVVDLVVKKRYVFPNEQPGCAIFIGSQ